MTFEYANALGSSGLYPEDTMASTRHLVDPELLQLLDDFPTLRLTSETLADIRAARAELLAQQIALEPAFPDIEVTEQSIPGPQGASDVRVLVSITLIFKLRRGVVSSS